MKKVLILTVAVVLGLAMTVQAAVLYSEDFEGNNPQSLTAYGWTNVLGTACVQVQSCDASDSDGIVGCTAGQVNQRYAIAVAAPSDDIYTLTADLYIWATGTQASGIGLGEETSWTGCAFLFFDNGADKWRMDTSFGGIDYEWAHLAGTGLGTGRVQLTLEVDRVNNVITGTIVGNGSNLTHSRSFSAGDADGLDNIVILNNTLGSYGYGIDIDNIEVAEVPEPATLAVLLIGGCLSLLARRRK
jgi:hypothetical protein